MSNDPILKSLLTRLSFVDCYLADLKLQFPKQFKRHAIDFSSMETLLYPTEALIHVTIILKMELENKRWKRLTGFYVADHLRWLEVLKNAQRAAIHLEEQLKEEFPAELDGFTYRSPVHNEIQKTWSILTFASQELTKSIVVIENSFPERKPQFDAERVAYAAVWDLQQNWEVRDPFRHEGSIQ
jgi:hypothetical protein